MTDELIERMCEAFGGLGSVDWDTAPEWERDEVRRGMTRALAVFEAAHARNAPDPAKSDIPDGEMSLNAHAPTDDEREALDAVIGNVRWPDAEPVIGGRVGGMIRDAVLAAAREVGR